jgi:hypothetical protein
MERDLIVPRPGSAMQRSGSHVAVRQLHDLHPAWLHWRRARMEDATPHRFNVPPSHMCWAKGRDSTNIEVVDGRLNLYGCTECGRLHECLADAGACPVLQNPHEMNYSCAFSGRVVADADSVIGGWDLEQMARSAAFISRDSWAHVAPARQAVSAANYTSSSSERNRQMNIAKHARELNTGNRLMAKFNTIWAKKDKSRPKTTLIEELDEEREQEQDNTRARDDDQEPGDKATFAVNGLDGDARRCMYAPEERTRDCAFHQRYFAPLEERLADLKSLFHRRTAPPPPPSPLALSASSPSVQRGVTTHTVRDGVERLRQSVTAAVRVLEALTMDVPLPRAESGWPPVDSRIAYYTAMTSRLIPIVVRKALEALQEAELNKHVAVALLDVLASPLRLQDSFGSLLFAWVADPWLYWCKHEGRVVHALLQYESRTRTEDVPYHGRLAPPSRKRKRRDSGDALTPEALDALKSVSDPMLRALIGAAKNISHQGNTTRTVVNALTPSPIGLYSLLHSALLDGTGL